MRANLAMPEPETATTLARRVALRARSLLSHLHIEIAELVSIVVAGSWSLSLGLYPHFLSTSVYLANIERHLSREVFLAVAGVLFLYQTICLMLGGAPIAPPSPQPTLPPMPTPDEARRSRRWLYARQFGLLVGVFTWSTLAFLLAPSGVITPGTSQYAAGAVCCAWGVWRFSFLIAQEKAYIRYRGIRAAAQGQNLAEPGESKTVERFAA